MAYETTDRIWKRLEREIDRQFARNRNVIRMDALNVIERSHDIYDSLEDEVKVAYLEIAEEVYANTVQKKDEPSPISMVWVLGMLAAYDAVTKYIFSAELERKRSRMAEAVIASSKKLTEIIRARNLLKRQVWQGAINIEDAAMLAAYRVDGVKKVRWVTAEDERRCAECGGRHGKVYSIDSVPPKPHHNCRCYLVPADRR